MNALYAAYLDSTGICTDTRQVVSNSIFFALKGPNFNGNQYADVALNNGCKLAVIDEPEYVQEGKTMLVDNVLETLQNLGRHHRKHLTIPVIGITGSNGKTSSKELIASVLSQHFKVFATKGNLNNHIGVPLSLLSIGPDIEMAVIEMGANAPNEIGELCTISNPDFGLITNIGKAHLEGFGSLAEIKRTKNQLFESVISKNGLLFVHGDDPVLMELSEQANRKTFGQGDLAEEKGTMLPPSPFVSLVWEGTQIDTHLIGNYNFPNIMAAVTIGKHFGVPKDKIIEGISNYVPDNNRSQLTKTASNTLILDAYNANPVSMSVAVENFSHIEASNKIAILGDMLELGEFSTKEHQDIVHQLVEQNIPSAFLVGKEFSKTQIPNNFKHFADASSVIAYLGSSPITDHLILIKGSRGIRLETLKESL